MIKIDSYDIKCVHDHFFTASDNQIDILEDLRSAVTCLSNLADFQGAAADSVKSYMVDVHTQIINSFETVLMEMEVKLLMLYQDFNATVDSSENAVVCDEYLNEVIYDMNDIIKPSHYYSTYTGSVVKSLDDIIYLKAPPWDEFMEQIKSAKADAENTLEQLINFENRHINDLENINNIFKQIESLCLYIYNTKNITKHQKLDSKIQSPDLPNDLYIARLINIANDANSLMSILKALFDLNHGDSFSFIGKILSEIIDQYLRISPIVLDGIDAIYDEQTNSYSDFDEAEFMAELTVDVVNLSGTLVAGLVFTPAGAIASIIISSIDFFKFGEPPKSFFEWESYRLKYAYSDVGNWVSKVFW